MYISNYNRNENIEEVKTFIKANSFGILLTSRDNRVIGSHVPLELEKDIDGNEVIYGHISKANNLFQDFDYKNDEVLLIYNGPHAYVSSSWYNHENVPTWNYIAVHVYGKLEIIEEKELKYSLSKLMDKYESNMENPQSIESLSDKTMRQMNGIIGFKIHINRIQAAYKLSQNRNKEDYENVIEKLENSTDKMSHEVARIMKKRE